MNAELMKDRIETERLVLFPYTQENLALFNSDLGAFEERFGVFCRGEELDHLLRGFLLRLEREIAGDPDGPGGHETGQHRLAARAGKVRLSFYRPR